MNSPHDQHEHDPHDFWEAMKTYKFLTIYIAIIVTLQIVLRIAGWR